jgi:ATP-binding cassette subfamily B protein
VLDDPFSAVDVATELRIIAALREQRATVLLCSTRLSAFPLADRVVVLDAGRVVERGRPREPPGRQRTLRTDLPRAATGGPSRRGTAMTASVGRPLVALVRPWRGRLVLVGLGVLAAAVLDVVPPLIMSRVVDTLVAGEVTGLPLAAALYLLALSAAQVLTAGYGYLASSIAQRVLAVLRGDVFGHLLALPTEYHDRTPVGDAVARATADVETIDDLFSSSIVTLLGETIRLVTVAVTMVLLSPLLSTAVALVIPPLVGLTLVMRRRIRSAERATRTAVAEATAQLQEDLAGAEVIRAYGRRSEFAPSLP